jgi:hypothetical protein
MALIAEELLQEWLNCDGYFTIRGALALSIPRLGERQLATTQVFSIHM